MYELYEYLSISGIVLASIPWLALPMTLLYALLRWRNAALPRRDTQLGMKFALHALLSAGVLTGLTGLTIVLASVIDAGTSARFNLMEEAEVGSALLVAGVVMTGAHWWILIHHTNERHWPMTRRFFEGVRLIISGCVAMIGLIGFLISLVEMTDLLDESVVGYGVTFTVWTGSWIVHVHLLRGATFKPDVPGGDGRCASCGYDLRATIASGMKRCPECGEPFLISATDSSQTVAKS